MSNNLRLTTFQIAFDGNEAIAGLVTVSKAVKDVDAVVKELTQQLGENAKVTVKNVESKKRVRTASPRYCEPDRA